MLGMMEEKLGWKVRLSIGLALLRTWAVNLIALVLLAVFLYWLFFGGISRILELLNSI